MIINMFVAATAGTLIPLALRAMKVDPALASVRVHHDADRHVRLLFVPRAGDALHQVSAPPGVEMIAVDGRLLIHARVHLRGADPAHLQAG